MRELITEIAIYLGIASFLGFLLGYLIWGLGQRRRIAAARAEAAAGARTSVDGDSPLRAQMDTLRRERDRLANRVEVLSAEVASLAASQPMVDAMVEADVDVAESLGTVEMRVGENTDADLEAAAEAFPRPAARDHEDASIFAEVEPADDDSEPEEVLDLAKSLEGEDEPARPFFRRKENEDSAEEESTDATPDAVPETAAAEIAAPDSDEAEEPERIPGAPVSYRKRRRLFDPKEIRRELSAQDESPFVDAEVPDADVAEAEDGVKDVTVAVDPGADHQSKEPADPTETPTHEPDADASLSPDDLTRVKGIGKATQAALNSTGIFQLRQLADMSDDDAERIGAVIGGLPDRLVKGRWREQAREMIGSDADG